MKESVNVTIRVDKDLKDKADRLFGELGISFSTAIKVFLCKCVRENKIPFKISMHEEDDTLLLKLIYLYISSGEADINELTALRDSLNETIENRTKRLCR